MIHLSNEYHAGTGRILRFEKEFYRREKVRKTERKFEKIYTDNYQQVYSFLYKLCHDSEAADKMSKEAFFHAFKRMVLYKGQCEMLTWLLHYARKMFVKYLNKTDALTLPVNLYVSNPEASVNDEPGFRINEEVDVAKLRSAFSKLTKKEGDILILRIFGDVSFAELGRFYGISADSSKLIYLRVRDKVKEEIL